MKALYTCVDIKGRRFTVTLDIATPVQSILSVCSREHGVVMYQVVQEKRITRGGSHGCTHQTQTQTQTQIQGQGKAQSQSQPDGFEEESYRPQSAELAAPAVRRPQTRRPELTADRIRAMNELFSEREQERLQVLETVELVQRRSQEAQRKMEAQLDAEESAAAAQAHSTYDHPRFNLPRKDPYAGPPADYHTICARLAGLLTRDKAGYMYWQFSESYSQLPEVSYAHTMRLPEFRVRKGQEVDI